MVWNLSFYDKFATISAYPNNYDDNKRSFGANQKIKNANANDYDYNFLSDGTPYTFEDIMKIFENVNLEINEYNESFWTTFELNLKNKGIDSKTASKIREYLQDCIMYADTPATYSERNQ